MNDLTKELINVIDETYLFHAGPIGSFICEEALDNWKANSTQLHYNSLTKYIDALAAELPDESYRKEFALRLLTNKEIVSLGVLNEHLKSMSN